MATKKRRRFGNPARQAEIDAAARAQARAAQAAAVAATRKRKESSCDTCCD
ncbi:hypothetical protein [Salinispora arenicola]|uniref:hypothetical protein n=1 Tax=Salinispora arenicola TaxID=168697 RepID=UPI0012BD1D7C|nr:hypothetical protein [Salinispora arenicola]